MDFDWEKEVAGWTQNAEGGGRDLFEKTRPFQEKLDVFLPTGLYPYFQPLDTNDGPVAHYRGREVLMLGSNNYLGLTTHPKVREAAADAVRRYGPSMTGSRFLNGTLQIHEDLEERLASFVGKEASLVFTTGYQTNLGILSALINRHAVALVDKFCHASIHDGCRLAEGESIKFPHDNMGELESLLASVPEDRGALVMVDGVYSMEGNLARLQEIVPLVKKYGARIAVDDAHGIGVMGPGGRGTAHHFGVENEVDLIIGTFSKSLASIGGFVAGERSVINFIKHFGRPMIFSASLAPPAVAAARTALEILIQEPERAERARKNAQAMKRGLSEIGFETGAAEAAILPIVIGDSLKTFCIWKDLLDEGVYTNPVLYPAVAKGREMLRTSYLATHTDEHLEKALKIFQKVGKNYDLCRS